MKKTQSSLLVLKNELEYAKVRMAEAAADILKYKMLLDKAQNSETHWAAYITDLKEQITNVEKRL